MVPWGLLGSIGSTALGWLRSGNNFQGNASAEFRMLDADGVREAAQGANNVVNGPVGQEVVRQGGEAANHAAAGAEALGQGMGQAVGVAAEGAEIGAGGLAAGATLAGGGWLARCIGAYKNLRGQGREHEDRGRAELARARIQQDQMRDQAQRRAEEENLHRPARTMQAEGQARMARRRLDLQVPADTEAALIPIILRAIIAFKLLWDHLRMILGEGGAVENTVVHISLVVNS
jgi:hypothetical protein